MKETSILKPVQAGDYGKILPLAPKDNDINNYNTDGSKALSLWSK